MLEIRGVDASDPYREMVERYFSREFPANLSNKGNVLDSLTDALVGNSKVRFGSLPSPETLVELRKVINKAIDDNTPINLLVPWGSKKTSNTDIDIAELGALKMLACLQKRVSIFHPKGLRVNMRIEDTSGFHMFADEGPEALAASVKYCKDLVTLIKVLDLNFITPKLESTMMSKESYDERTDYLMAVFYDYLTETDAHGLESREELSSWNKMVELGWTGVIPFEMRDFYRDRYTKFYPSLDARSRTLKLAEYLAGALVRYKLNATGIESDWGKNFIQLNFAPPAPGTPTSIGERRLYYRTLPEDMTRNHSPAWRAHGYIKIKDDVVTPKLASWGEKLDLETSYLEFSRGEHKVRVRVDEMIC